MLCVEKSNNEAAKADGGVILSITAAQSEGRRRLGFVSALMTIGGRAASLLGTNGNLGRAQTQSTIINYYSCQEANYTKTTAVTKVLASAPSSTELSNFPAS